MVRGRIFLLIVVLTAPSLAAAETISFADSAAAIARSCGTDIRANCRGVNFDISRLKECLYRNQDVTSPQCKTDFFQSFDAIQKRIAARITVATSTAEAMCGRPTGRMRTWTGASQVGIRPS